MPACLVVDGFADDVLLRGAAALRRLRARITRYDVEALTLEARLIRRVGAALVRVRAVEETAGRTTLFIESERTSALPPLGGEAALVRRFRRELERVSTTPLGRNESR